MSSCQTRTNSMWQPLAGMEYTIGLRGAELSRSDSSGSWAQMLSSSTKLSSTCTLSLPGTIFGGTQGTWLGDLGRSLRSSFGIQIIHRCLLAQTPGQGPSPARLQRTPLTCPLPVELPQRIPDFSVSGSRSGSSTAAPSTAPSVASSYTLISSNTMCTWSSHGHAASPSHSGSTSSHSGHHMNAVWV